jgi:hypothetical protein
MELKIGDFVKLSEGESEAIHRLGEDVWTAKLAFSLASRAYRDAQEKLWDAVHESHPETIGCKLSHDPKARTLMVIGLKKDD